MIKEILDENQLGLKDIDRFAVAIGPGSYTGLRIGITTIKMFASILNKEVVGISTLQTLAKAGKENCLIIAALDARNDNYFAGGYVLKDGIPKMVIPDGHYHIDLLLKAVSEFAQKEGITELLFLGNIQKQDTKINQLQLDYQYGDEKQNVIHAGLLGQLAEFATPVDPDQLLPRYLRRTQAEVDWHKRTGKPFGPDSNYVEEV